jgi:diaminopropionate ammonia-lyase
LRALASAYAAVADADAQAACELLAGYGLHTTPSGAAGVAALRGIAASPADRERLVLHADSEVVVVLSEASLTDA